MDVIYFLIPIFALAPMALAQQVNVASCNRAWVNQNRCIRDNVASAARSDRAFPVPDQATQNRVKREIENCFKREGCTSPVPSVQESNARRDCFKAAKRQLNRDLKRCVDGTRKIRGWIPPDDYPKPDILDEWVYTYTRMREALRNPRPYCGNIKRKQALQQCAKPIYNFNQVPPRNLPPYWCDQDAKCWFDVGANCRGQWDKDIQPVVCQCSRSQGAEGAAANEYSQCLQRRTRRVTSGDPALNWLAEYNRGFCSNSNNHPCRRQRQEYDRSHG